MFWHRELGQCPIALSILVDPSRSVTEEDARDGWMKQVDVKRFHGIMLTKQRHMDECNIYNIY